jgi:hypothetical protein
MSDGRAFTDYRPRCAVNAELMSAVKRLGQVQSAFESRMFLQKNAEEIMARQRAAAVERLAPCAPCSFPAETMLPLRYVVKCDGVACTRTEVNPLGLGDSVQYGP